MMWVRVWLVRHISRLVYNYSPLSAELRLRKLTTVGGLDSRHREEAGNPFSLEARVCVPLPSVGERDFTQFATPISHITEPVPPSGYYQLFKHVIYTR
jgi:hypothetical protein